MEERNSFQTTVLWLRPSHKSDRGDILCTRCYRSFISQPSEALNLSQRIQSLTVPNKGQTERKKSFPGDRDYFSLHPQFYPYVIILARRNSWLYSLAK